LRRFVCTAFASFFALSIVPEAASADEDQPFVTLYTTMTEPAGEAELEQYFTWKSGHSDARFNEFQSRSEFEYGISDRVQGSLYLNYDYSELREHAPPGPLETERAFGVSGELIGRLLDVRTDPLGLALYVEPAWSAEEHSIETKLLLQKNFLNDRLTTVFNLNLEDTWVRNARGPDDEESALEFDFGAAWRMTEETSVGLEFDNERAFAGEMPGSRATEQSSSFYLGPTFAVFKDPWFLTLGVQTQLPIATGRAGMVAGGYASEAERFRATMRLTREF